MPNFVDQEQKAFERFYKTSLIWIKVRPTLKRLGVFLFLFTDTALILFFAWSFLNFGVFDYFAERALVGSIIEGSGDLHLISEMRGAKGIQEQETGVFGLTDNRADFYSVVSNPNDDWFVRFSYHFNYSGGETEPQTGFLLPGETEKTVTTLGVPVATIPRTAQIELDDIQWTRVDGHEIADYPTWAGDRLDFVFENVGYHRDLDLNGTAIARSTFTLTNNTAFGYWEPLFVIVLRRNNSIVGVTTTTTPRLQAGESRQVNVNWFGTTPSANATEIEPLIDLFDGSIYMPPSGVFQDDVRERDE